MAVSFLAYKGNIATSRYSVEDEIFFGKILGISDLVSFEAFSSLQLKSAFKSAVDDYLRTCKFVGKMPCRP